MTDRNRRRVRNAAIFLILAIISYGANRVLHIMYVRTAYVSGWFLFGMVILLAGYNVRKKLAFLPLGNSATWLQIHIYAALLSGVVFALHVAFRVPNGTFEILLAMLYLGTFTSGIAGLCLSRTIPQRLSARGEEVLFERIPVFIRQLSDEVEKAVFECVEQTGTTSIQHLYLNHVQPFFGGPRNIVHQLMHSEQPRETLILEINSHRRFLSETEQAVADSIAERVRKKDDLDYQYALQGVLKLWLFVHIPLTWGLIIFAIFHALAVHAYGG